MKRLWIAPALAALCALLLAGCQQNTETLHHYDDPVITSLSIPRAGISYAGNKLPVTIVGKNFKAPGISAADFSGTGVSNFKVISDAKATAEVSCPSAAGEYSVTVHCKNASKMGTFTVKDYSLWTPGKIVLADKTLSDKDGFTLHTANPPIAVVCGKNVYDAAIGVALHKSPPRLVWAKGRTVGYNTKFEGIVCTPSEWGIGAAWTAAFTGDTDGSDNWDYICSVDPEGTADAAVNYPAFDWVNNYNTTYEAWLGSARPSWYMPSIAELCQVYKNKKAINASLSEIWAHNPAYADSELRKYWYWSSSNSSNISANYVSFSNGKISGNHKDDGNAYVCCIACF
ncbi:hypothetical protein [Treponema parvum]|uniref:hypothetical protein n=1 Tax=Treponema parvum TaxID=138851 RepID=UPI00211F3C69|nr:hypothetical protein [Treponema parvum]